MTESSTVLEVVCPTCGGMKNLNIPSAILSHKKFGTVKIQVPLKAVCPEHQFLIFVDTKGTIRGYEKIDIQMVTIASKDEKDVAGPINLRKLIQIFGIYGVLSLIHAKIFNYTIYIIKDEDFEHTEEDFNSIGDAILPDSFKDRKTIYFLNEDEIDSMKQKKRNSLVIDTNKYIYQTPWTTKLKFEEEIIKRALDIIDEKEQLELMQQDIAKFIDIVNCTVAILDKEKEIYEDDLVEKITKSLNIKKINNYRLNLIKEFIRQNISYKIVSKIKNKVEEFLSVL